MKAPTDFHWMLYFVATFTIVNVGMTYLGTHPSELTFPMFTMFICGMGWFVYFNFTLGAVTKWWRQPYRTRTEEEIP